MFFLGGDVLLCFWFVAYAFCGTAVVIFVVTERVQVFKWSMAVLLGVSIFFLLRIAVRVFSWRMFSWFLPANYYLINDDEAGPNRRLSHFHQVLNVRFQYDLVSDQGYLLVTILRLLLGGASVLGRVAVFTVHRVDRPIVGPRDKYPEGVRRVAISSAVAFKEDYRQAVSQHGSDRIYVVRARPGGAASNVQ